MLSLQVKPLGIRNERTVPHAVVDIFGQVTNRDKGPCSVVMLSLEVRAFARELLVQPERTIMGVGFLRPGGSASFSLPVELPPRVLRAIDERRDPSRPVELRLMGHALVSLPGRAGEEPLLTQISPGEWDGDPLLLSRDEWIALLGRLEYDNISVFELRGRVFSGTGPLAEAQRHLTRAEQQHRRGNPEETLAACRAALEALAVREGHNVGAGFDALWAAIFREVEEPKRPIFNDLVRALSAYLHLGRHVRPTPVALTQEDGLLALRMTLSLLEMIGPRLERL